MADIYDRLGVKKLINADGPVTRIGGSLMPPEVIEAVIEANRAFVDIVELQERAGARIAQLVGVEAALVTAGAAAGLAVSAAACMAGADPVKAKQLPDTRGMKDEIVVLRSHRIHYDQAIRLSGARFVEVGFRDWSAIEDVANAMGGNTAAVFYVAKFARASGSVPLADVIALAKCRAVPVIVDAADELPPLSNLRRFVEMGADMVCFSGGKDIRGPQASGLIVGKKGWIEACAANNCPNYGVGRPMKVAKETIVGLVRAVELYVQQDFDAERRAWEAQRDYLVQRLSGLPHVHVGATKPISPGAPGSFYLPAAYVELDEDELGTTVDDVIGQLREGEPGIAVDRSPSGFVLRVHMLQPGEESLLAARLIEIVGRPS
jgi:uncharacterized pyridoxal phosphate-dependent enzyme